MALDNNQSETAETWTIEKYSERGGLIVSWQVVSYTGGIREVRGASMLKEDAELWVADHNAAQEVQKLREALERIAHDDEISYLSCADIPHCSGHPHNDECAVGIARAALGVSDD